MRFYGNGIVWDAERNTRLCKFKGGELDTSNERVIQLLSRMGYRYDGETEQKTPAPDGPTDEQIKDMAKQAGIRGYGIMKRETLIAKLNELGVQT